MSLRIFLLGEYETIPESDPDQDFAARMLAKLYGQDLPVIFAVSEERLAEEKAALIERAMAEKPSRLLAARQNNPQTARPARVRSRPDYGDEEPRLLNVVALPVNSKKARVRLDEATVLDLPADLLTHEERVTRAFRRVGLRCRLRFDD